MKAAHRSVHATRPSGAGSRPLRRVRLQGLRPRLYGIALAALVQAACGSPTGPLEGGTWGGTGIAMTVSETGASLEFDCATGLIPSRIVLAEGSFSLPGQVTIGHGGPVQENEPADVRGATFRGSVSGSLLRLEITLGDGTPMGPFEARRDRDPVLHRCL